MKRYVYGQEWVQKQASARREGSARQGERYCLESPPRVARAFSILAWAVLATAYTTPATPPTAMAETLPRLAGSPKNKIPDAATGSLRARQRTFPQCGAMHLLVQGTDHRVGSGAADANAPRGRVGDEGRPRRRRMQLPSRGTSDDPQGCERKRAQTRWLYTTATDKFRVRLATDQFSTRTEKMSRIGIDKRLL